MYYCDAAEIEMMRGIRSVAKLRTLLEKSRVISASCIFGRIMTRITLRVLVLCSRRNMTASLHKKYRRIS